MRSTMKLVLIVILFFVSATLQANTIDTKQLPLTRISLQATTPTFKPGDDIYLKVVMTPKEHWHIYWKNPGDSGVAPQFNWQLPDGMKVLHTYFPTPARIPVEHLINYGYDQKTTMIVELKTSKDFKSGSSHPIKLHAEWLVCELECIPEMTRLAVNLKADNQAATPNKTEILNSAGIPKILNTDAQFQEKNKKLLLTFNLPNINLNTVKDAYFFPAEESLINISKQQTFSIDKHTLTFTLDRAFKALPNTLHGVLKLIDNTGATLAYTITAKPAASSSFSWSSFIITILFALLGGLILNIMPCVFPILFIKALALVKHNHCSLKTKRRHGYAYTLGVVVCFFLLGLILITLQGLGDKIGWGFQLQSPAFVLAMIYLFFLIALNLLGFFEITLAIGQNVQVDNQRYTGSFFVGFLAALVATPCTAPFMATALAYTIAQPALIALAIFVALGIGMAIPYLVISIVPFIQSWLPKPGRWMQIFKEILAFPMLITLAWLVWILSQQVSGLSMFWMVCGLVVISFCIWLTHAYVQHRLYRWVIRLITLGLIITSLTLMTGVTTPTTTTNTTSIAFSPDKLKTLLADHKKVFVNATAAWCITCKVNEQTTLSRQSIKDLFKEQGITYMVADWTNRNAEITDYLKQFNRNGVPLYVYYNEKGEAKVLPQLLTPSTLETTILGKSTQGESP